MLHIYALSAAENKSVYPQSAQTMETLVRCLRYSHTDRNHKLAGIAQAAWLAIEHVALNVAHCGSAERYRWNSPYKPSFNQGERQRIEVRVSGKRVKGRRACWRPKFRVARGDYGSKAR